MDNTNIFSKIDVTFNSEFNRKVKSLIFEKLITVTPESSTMHRLWVKISGRQLSRFESLLRNHWSFRPNVIQGKINASIKV